MLAPTLMVPPQTTALTFLQKIPSQQQNPLQATRTEQRQRQRRLGPRGNGNRVPQTKKR